MIIIHIDLNLVNEMAVGKSSIHDNPMLKKVLALLGGMKQHTQEERRNYLQGHWHLQEKDKDKSRWPSARKQTI
jgi:hypothetical protein